jgi:hypothetical protein
MLRGNNLGSDKFVAWTQRCIWSIVWYLHSVIGTILLLFKYKYVDSQLLWLHTMWFTLQQGSVSDGNL